MPVKLLLYTFDWFPLVGGIQTVTLDLASGLAALRDAAGGAAFDVTLVTRTAAAGMDDAVLPFRVVRRSSFGNLARLMHASDLIHIANPTLLALAAAWLVRKPTVVEHHGYQSNCPNGLLLYGVDNSVCPGHFMAGRYAKCVECNAARIGRLASVRSLLLAFPRRWLCKRVACNIAVSDHVARRINLPRTRTIHHGIPDSGFRPVPDRGGSGRPLRIGYIGRLVEEKGVTVLFDAAARLKRDGCAFTLEIIGDGDERDKLEALGLRLGLSDRLQFRGYLASELLQQTRLSLDVLVMPSICEETAGLAAIEQMMCGGVIVATDIGGLGETVGDAGLKFPPRDAEALHGRLKQLLDDPQLLARLSVTARARAMQLFPHDSMIERHAKLYRTILRR